MTFGWKCTPQFVHLPPLFRVILFASPFSLLSSRQDEKMCVCTCSSRAVFYPFLLSLGATHDDDDLKAPQRENGTKADVNPLPSPLLLLLLLVRLVPFVFLTVQSISGRMSLFRRRSRRGRREFEKKKIVLLHRAKKHSYTYTHILTLPK